MMTIMDDPLADHDSLSTQRYFQGKQLSRVVTLVLDHEIALYRRKSDNVSPEIRQKCLPGAEKCQDFR